MTRAAPGRWLRLPVLVAASVSITAVGCRHDNSAPYPDWIPVNAAPARTGAFADLRQIGLEAEASVRGMERRAAPSGSEVRKMDAKLAPLVDAATRATHVPMVDDYTAEASLEPNLSRIGWAALGGVFERRLHAAVAKQEYDVAVRVFDEGTRFALIISCGDASDALVGFPIADALRRILAPSLRDFSAAQLSSVARATADALSVRLSPTTIAAHERLAMLGAIQAVQNAYRDDRLAELSNRFGLTTKDAFDALLSYKGRAESRRVVFFAAMAADAETEARWLDKASATPAALRTPEPKPKLSSKQPWHSLARQFVLAGGAMLTAGDVTIARTRLLALTCDLFAIAKTSGAAPRDLSLFPPALDTDPYTGHPFFYVPEGLDFNLYSAGADGIDNGGDTDDTGLQPDLKLEGFY
ncbi:MAG: hypothetical protein ACYC96_04490 [Fimbriimonadaceae bacterium]